MRNLVKVVIPFYKNNLTSFEFAAISNTINVLSCYHIVLLVPDDIDEDDLILTYPILEIIKVPAEWLGKGSGINGYRRMIMSKNFYELFNDTEYILLCHIDTWVFKDRLYEWCQKDYDFIAAPLPNNSYFNYQKLRQYLRYKLNAKINKNQGYSLYNNLHNGGFSLRKVSSFIAACEDYAKDCHEEKGNTEKEPYANNLSEKPTNNLKYPTVEEALDFAFARNPSFCFTANDKRLPMACDRPNHKRRISFWKKFIPYLGNA